MGARTIRDPDGVELKKVLLHVVEEDGQGPLMLRVRRDHEKIELSDDPDRVDKFLIAWSPVNSVFGELRLSDIFTDLEEVKAKQELLSAERVQQAARLRAAEQSLQSMEEENRVKTEALRVLQKERDPERIVALVRERVEQATEALAAELRQAKVDAEALQREVAELRTAKKRLKEANERLKGGR